MPPSSEIFYVGVNQELSAREVLPSGLHGDAEQVERRSSAAIGEMHELVCARRLARHLRKHGEWVSMTRKTFTTRDYTTCNK